MQEKFKVVRRGPCAEVGLCVSVLSPDTILQLGQHVSDLGADDTVHAILIHSLGDHFSYGLDLRAAQQQLGPILRDRSAPDRYQLHNLIRQMQAALDLIERCKVPVIAAVDGWCVGAGLDLATACDIRFATQAAVFSLRETKVAMVADLGVLQRLPSIVGRGHAREMAYTGGDVDAIRAARIGLVNDVLPDGAALLCHARQICDDIASNSPLVVRGVKEVLSFTSHHEESMRYVATWNAAFLPSDDLVEAMQAFADKRLPRFKGT